MCQRRIAFVSTFPPRQCGIATFTLDLVENVSKAAEEGMVPTVVAMSDSEQPSYGEPVQYEIRTDVADDYVSAADYLNAADIDIVSLQHEFGLFGGETGSGEYIEYLLERIEAPLVTTFHTILLNPSIDQYWVMRRIADNSAKVVVMSVRGAEMLRQIYDVPAQKIRVIPHGIPDLPLVATSQGKRVAGLEDRTIILTFGLLGPNKGIEVMIQAMSDVVKEMPDALYVVLGATHPNVLSAEGESYRRSLESMAQAMGLEWHVAFHNEFVSNRKLHKYLQMADFYVTPYLLEKQIVSGTLAFALGVGRVIISTPYWYAQELLADGHGRLVPFNDPEAIAQAILQLKNNPEDYLKIHNRAYAKGRTMTWPVVGEAYWRLFCDVAENELKSPMLLVQGPDGEIQTRGNGLEPMGRRPAVQRYASQVSQMQSGCNKDSIDLDPACTQHMIKEDANACDD